MKALPLLLICGLLMVSCSPKEEEKAAAQGQDLSRLPSSLTPEVVIKGIEGFLVKKNRSWCVPTPGLVQVDERVLYYDRNPTRPQAVMSPNFKELLTYLQGQSLLELTPAASDTGDGVTVTFLPKFRQMYGVLTNEPIRGASLSNLCLGPIRVKEIVSSRVANYKGYRWTDVKVRVGGDSSTFPEFVSNPMFREIAGWNVPGVRKPEVDAFGDARLELQDGSWFVMSVQ